MKKILIPIAVAALFLNLYVFVAWMYSYLITVTPDETSAAFIKYLPAWLSISVLTIINFLTTVISIIIFARFKTEKNHTALTSGIILQAAFLLLYAWQQM